jgi:hypothetical protein
MSFYRVYPLDPAGRVLAPLDADCADDTEAIVFARDLGQQVRHGCEVWQMTRFVGRFYFEGARAPAAARLKPRAAQAEIV